MKKSSFDLCVFFIVIMCLIYSCGYTQHKAVNDKWICKCELQPTLINYSRIFINDTVYTLSINYDSSNEILSDNIDTFIIRKDETFYKRGKQLFTYFSEKSFSNGDTIKLYYSTPVNALGNRYAIRDYYIPVKTIIYNSKRVLVYSNGDTELYYDPEIRRTVYLFSLASGKCILLSDKSYSTK